MRRRTFSVAAALVVVSLSAQATEAQGQQDVATMAVMDFNAFMMGEAGASVNLGKAISSMLVTEFSGREGIRIVERRQLMDLIQEQDLSLSGRVDDAVAIEVGKLLGVQYVLLGQAMSIVDNLRIDIRAVDVETSEVIAVMKKTAETIQLLNVVVELADELSEALSLSPLSARPAVEAIPVVATIALSRALTYEDDGDIQQAVEQYEAVLAIHPTHRDAQRALERLRGGS
ncbi:MAG: CsgG/HfaB family protein [Longimicrobiales bacterium]|nr:CsgG/HfaB family protein [Longimicrobiales bacterium]